MRDLSKTLRSHWPEYLIEAWALGTYMLSAAAFATVLQYPQSALHRTLMDAGLRRLLFGVALGLTAIAIIYSPWGKRSGAHMNPSVTLAFFSLGRIRAVDAAFFIVAQFLGGTLGVLVAWLLLGTAFTAPPVSFAVTVPRDGGIAVAFFAELAISAGLIFAVLLTRASVRAAPFTGLVAGALIATFVAVESPLSGMSMNPARSFASAAASLMWRYQWIYFTAPVAGMLLGATLYRSAFTHVPCAKLIHPPNVRCIHCGCEPTASRPGALPTAKDAQHAPAAHWRDR